MRTVYKGATAQVIESAITQPLEDSLSGIEGIKTIKSQSREEVSQITITFVAAREIDGAANDVRDRVARIRKNLPAASDNSVVSKIEADAQPILWIALSSDRHSPMEMSDYADRYLTDPLKALPGVASVIIGGERKYAMRVWLDRERLAAQGLTAQDVEDALNRENLDSPSGRIESTEREFTVQARTDLRSPEEFNNMVIKEVNGYPIRLKDVGRAAPGPYENRKIVRVRRRGRARPGRGQAVHRQYPRGGASCQGAAPAFAGHAAARHEDVGRGGHVQVHPGLHRCGVPHHHRGADSGRAGDLLLPARGPRHA